MKTELSELQRRLYQLMHAKRDKDVALKVMFDWVYPFACATPSLRSSFDARDMQQKLAPLISRVNAKIEAQNMRIEPGKLKQTYRLNTKTKA